MPNSENKLNSFSIVKHSVEILKFTGTKLGKGYFLVNYRGLSLVALLKHFPCNFYAWLSDKERIEELNFLGSYLLGNS